MKLIVLSLLLVLALSDCPNCREGACNQTLGHIDTCSECVQGSALMKVVTLVLDKPDMAMFNETIGVCQTCPPGCVLCQIAMMVPTHWRPTYAANCTNCLSGYVHNYELGECKECPSHCAVCDCAGTSCGWTVCMACYPNYRLVNGTCVYNGSITTMKQQIEQQY